MQTLDATSMTPTAAKTRRGHLLAAIEAHRCWLTGLEMAVCEGASWVDLDTVEPEAACEFGRYLADLASRGGASQLPRYRQVREMHAGFHTLAGQVLRLAQAGRQDQARVLCESDLQSCGMALLAAMSAWVREIEGRLSGQAGQHIRSETQP